MIIKTPPMGWNSWNTFGSRINEQMICEMADTMVSEGLLDCGYEYLVIDDCWQAKKQQAKKKLEDIKTHDCSLFVCEKCCDGIYPNQLTNAYSYDIMLLLQYQSFAKAIIVSKFSQVSFAHSREWHFFVYDNLIVNTGQ